MHRAKQRRSSLGGKSRSDTARDGTRRGIPRTERAPDRINDPPLDFVNDGPRQFFELQSDGVFCQLLGKSFHSSNGWPVMSDQFMELRGDLAERAMLDRLNELGEDIAALPDDLG